MPEGIGEVSKGLFVDLKAISVHLRGVEVSVKASLCVNISSLMGHDQSLKDSLLT